MLSNHVSLNLVTKGILNSSIITKGIISFVEIKTTHHKKGRPGPLTAGIIKNYKYEYDKPLFKEIKNKDDINLIKVHVNLKNSKKVNKKLSFKLLKKQIKSEILEKTGKDLKIKIVED